MAHLALRPGIRNGVSIAAGRIGEIITGTAASTINAPNSIASVSLTPGCWVIFGFANNGGSAGTAPIIGISTSGSGFDSQNFITGNSDYPGSTIVYINSVMRNVNISSNTTYYLYMSSGSAVAGSYISAVRIA